MKTQLILILALFLSTAAQALPLNGCGTPTKNGYVVQTTNGAEPVSIVTLDQAKQIFQELKNQKYKIPYLNAQTNCDLRSHKVAQILSEKWNLKTVKVYVEAENDIPQGAGAPAFTRDESVESDGWASLSGQDITGQYYTWSYHTAPAICVRQNGEDRLYSLDMSLYSEPVSLKKWVSGLTADLSANQYSIYGKEMYSLSLNRHAAKATTFSRQDSKYVDKMLKADLRLHKQKLSAIPSRSAKTVITTKDGLR